MTTSGTKNQHFLCQMKMESEVACAHSVTLTKTVGLTIDKAGVVGAELGYSYPAGQGLIAQDVGILPTSCGDGKLFAAITSPYFVTPSGLKIKRDVIDIQVECEEPDGWKGTDHGVLWFSNFSGNWQEPDLHYKYTHPIGGAVYFDVGILPAGRGVGIIAVGPETLIDGGYSSGGAASVLITIPGVYRIYVYADQDLGSSNSQTTLETLTFTAKLRGNPGFPNVTAKRRGEIRVRTTNYGGLSPFSGISFGAIAVEYRRASGASAPYYTRLPSGVGGQTYTCVSSGIPPSASGSLGVGQAEAGTIYYPAPGGAIYGADVLLLKV